MLLSQVYESGKFGLSFELFPPKSAVGEEEMFRHVEQLTEFKPDFITCTYGAGGSTREKTLGIVEQVKQPVWLRYGFAFDVCWVYRGRASELFAGGYDTWLRQHCGIARRSAER